MGMTLTHRILSQHRVAGELVPGEPIGIRIDQTLTQDATGTTAFLLLEAMGVQRVRTELSVSYVDHNMAQFGPENHNDHLYLQSAARKLGAYHSRPGSGICHQVHLERFARPGRTLLGSDSHTPTAGGMGMIAIGAGGLDVAVAMGGGAFHLACPRVIGVELRGRLRPPVAPKDIVLRLLSILTTQGNVGCVVEYHGAGAARLSVPARATCTNMGAEMGLTTSLFPSDEQTRLYLEAQGRAEDFVPLAADEPARYDTITKRLHAERNAAVIRGIRQFGRGVKVSRPDKDGYCQASLDRLVIDLSKLEPLAAAPSSPDRVEPVAQLAAGEPRKVAQVLIGSCTNSSFQDLMIAARAMKGRTVHPGVELAIAPGSRQVLAMLAANGALRDLVLAGARILEAACGPCIGLGLSPAEGAVSLRTFNRNFPGRSGTEGDQVYLVSPQTAVAAALTGQVTDPRTLDADIQKALRPVPQPRKFLVEDGMIQPPLPPEEAASAEIVRGPTIVRPPPGERLPARLEGAVLIKVGDKVTTDAIIPAGELLKHRSNVPEYAKHVFGPLNRPGEPTFAERAEEARSRGRCGVVVAGESYGQGSSREHAALCPMYLGVRAVLAKGIERIHEANLVNFAILPLVFESPADYDRIDVGDELLIEDVPGGVASAQRVTVRDAAKGFDIVCLLLLSPRQRSVLAAGGLLNYTREGGQ